MYGIHTYHSTPVFRCINPRETPRHRWRQVEDFPPSTSAKRRKITPPLVQPIPGSAKKPQIRGSASFLWFFSFFWGGRRIVWRWTWSDAPHKKKSRPSRREYMVCLFRYFFAEKTSFVMIFCYATLLATSWFPPKAVHPGDSSNLPFPLQTKPSFFCHT